ncbi:MAG: SDR family oxidoreductase [Rhodospirillaceae bacterium]
MTGVPRPEDARILVTGSSGYIGTVLMGELAARGYSPDGLDAGFYDNETLYRDGNDSPPRLVRDTRDLQVADLAGYDVVMHLAELSNDPLCMFNGDFTYDINYRGSATLAGKARDAGVRRFVYASSCSIYGTAGGDAAVTEEYRPDPQTAYARCKFLVEQDVRALASPDFTPVFLRNATAFGASPSMRFDVVVNNLCGQAWSDRRIALTSDGSPWRPLVHVRDICGAMIAAMEADADRVRGEAFNVGSDDQNYRVREIAEAVAAEFPGCELTLGGSDSDNRSYRVSFAKIRERLPEFRCQWNLERGTAELRQVFERIAMSRETFESPTFTRLRRIRELIESGRLDDTLRWRSPDLPQSTDVPRAADRTPAHGAV